MPFGARLLLVGLLTAAAVPELERPARASGGELTLTVTDGEGGKPTACRISIRGQNGKPFKPKKVPFWNDHFLISGKVTLQLPVGNYAFEIERGPEYSVRFGHFEINHFANDSKTIDLKRYVDMAGRGWYSGDLEIHRSAEELPLVLDAEDLYVGQAVSWWNDKRLIEQPGDEAWVTTEAHRGYSLQTGGQSGPGGTFLFFHLKQPLAWPGAAAEYPSILDAVTAARQTKGAWVDAARSYYWDLPMLVAHRAVDSVQIASGQLGRERILPDDPQGPPRDKSRYPEPWGSALWAQQVYFHLLNCGLRLPPSAGSGSGRTLNPVGACRMYVQADGELDYEKWWAGFKAGRVVVTNGPLLQPRVYGQPPGHLFQAGEGEKLEFEVELSLSTRDTISYLEIVQDGRVAHSVPLQKYVESGQLPRVRFERSGWFLVRAVTDLTKTYRFAMTAPYYVQIGYKPRVSKESAQFFLDWVYRRAKSLQITDPQQRKAVLDAHRRARDFWQKLVDEANAE